jgi:hypothetical protein
VLCGLQQTRIGRSTQASGREGTGRPACDRCPGARGRPTPNRCLERAPGQADADAILADDRRRLAAGYWFLWVRCPACRTTNAIDLRTLDRHRDAAVTSLILVALWLGFLRGQFSAKILPVAPNYFVSGLCVLETQSEYARRFEI